MIREAFKKIAGENRTTPSEVLKEIQTAIDIGYNSDDPFIRARWRKLGFYHKPTPEEFIMAIAMVISD